MASFIESLRKDTPEYLNVIERILGNEKNNEIVNFMFQKQNDIPSKKLVGFHLQTGKPEFYHPGGLVTEKMTVKYISKNLGMDEKTASASLAALTRAALVNMYCGEKGCYFAITGTADNYIKESVLHIVKEPKGRLF